MNVTVAAVRARATSLLAAATTLLLSALLVNAGPALAQRPEARIVLPVDNSVRVTLAHSTSPMARAETDAGRMAGDETLQGVSLLFSRSGAQQSALDALVAAQVNPNSPQFQQWLSPDQFGAMFGAADTDIAKAETWLQSQGFTVEGVSRSRDRVRFTGTIAQLETAFGTEMHTYRAADAMTGAQAHFGPIRDLSIPAALAPSVLGVSNISDLHPKPRVKVMPSFTSGQTGNHFVGPKDVATIYDVNAAYNAGWTGAGQTIVVVGQSAIVAGDVTNFQKASGTAVRAPVITLVPLSGTSMILTGDDTESDLDVEYTGAMAPGATINFVYTGTGNNYGVFDSVQYAVTNKLGQIISVSYGLCEAGFAQSDYLALNQVLQQGAAQGQSIIVASGDSGSTDCYPVTSLPTATRQSLAVDLPAASQYVTAMGGTEYLASAVTSGANQYWSATSGTDIVSSALSYIPEMAWNDDSSANGLSSGGGGYSTFTPLPSWQTGVPGIPVSTFRMVPDISLASSPNNAGYLYCSSDTKATNITGSCTNGFRDANNSSVTVAGGTSFAAPVFAGMLALINQSLGNTAGQGVINPVLYKLASNPTTYALAFHDITAGGNACLAGSVICTSSTTTSYAAGMGFDLATGLGSVDLNNLLTKWSSAVTTTGTIITETAMTNFPASGAPDPITIVVKGATVLPTGKVSVSVDGGTATMLTLTQGTAALTAVAVYNFSSAVQGPHTISASYPGDTNNPAVNTSLIVTVIPAGSFTLSAPALSISAGSTGTEAVTVTPTGGYLGPVTLTLTTATPVSNACYIVSNPTVSGSAAVSGSATIYTNQANCPVGALALHSASYNGTARLMAPVQHGRWPAGVALAGLMMVGFAGRRSKRLRSVLAVALLAVAGFGMSGCGSTNTSAGSGTGISTLAAKGTYTVTVKGVDTITGADTATTTFTLTIQ